VKFSLRLSDTIFCVNQIRKFGPEFQRFGDLSASIIRHFAKTLRLSERVDLRVNLERYKYPHYHTKIILKKIVKCYNEFFFNYTETCHSLPREQYEI
jgi:imidazoleglycerol phosphate dehydratase HisB